MPNGYTAAIYEGADVTVADFLMRVGRGMTFAVMQRDEDLDAPVRPVAPSDYHANALEEARQEVAALDAISDAEAATRAAEDYRASSEEWQSARVNAVAMRERYADMIAQVEAWEPDPLVAVVKYVALKYLREGMEFDCGLVDDSVRYYPPPVLLSAADWLARQREQARREVDYHASEHEKEVERAAKRNTMIAAFLSSLPTTAEARP